MINPILNFSVRQRLLQRQLGNPKTVRAEHRCLWIGNRSQVALRRLRAAGRRKAKLRVQFRAQPGRSPFARRFVQHVEGRVLAAGEFDMLLDRIAARELDPYTAVDQILKRAIV